MINLTKEKQTEAEIVLTGNNIIDEFGIGAFKRVSTVKTLFYPMDLKRTQGLFNLLQRMCIHNGCDGLVIAASDISSQLKLYKAIPHSINICFEQADRIDEVFEAIRKIERKTIVLILDFDIYYDEDKSGEYIGNSKKQIRYYYDILCSRIKQKNTAALVESEYNHIEAFCQMAMTSIDNDEYIIFDNGTSVNISK